MRYQYDHFPSLRQFFEMTQHGQFRFLIQFIKRLIQNDKIRLFVQSPGNCDSLPLPPADVPADLGHHFLKVRRGFNERTSQA
jgi:hypothetical protein